MDIREAERKKNKKREEKRDKGKNICHSVRENL